MSLPALKTKRSVAHLATDDPVEREVGLQKLLSTRICDLQLEPQDVLAECLAQVGGELRASVVAAAPVRAADTRRKWATRGKNPWRQDAAWSAVRWHPGVR